MIGQDLEVTLHMAFVEARQARYEVITVEHLLLALLDNPSAAKVLRACACNIEDLRKSLQHFLSDNTPVLPQSSEADTQPTLGFQRVIQRAIMHVQSTSLGKKAVSGANVLVAIFGEKDSHAVYYLHQQGVTRAEIQIQTGADLCSGNDVAATTVSARKLDIPRVLPDDEVYDLRQEGATRADVVNRRSRGITKALREAVKDIVKRRWRSITKALQSRAVIAQELEVSLHMAFVEARQARHKFLTVEHLLLALLDNPLAAEVLRACACNIEDLRKTLQNFLSDNTPVLPQSSEADTQPTLGFQRVIQRAIMYVQSASNGKKVVTGANVLVAIFGEKDSHAVYYLHQQGVTRLDVVNYSSHGITMPPQGEEKDKSRGVTMGQDLEVALHMAFVAARQARYEVLTVEHLLLALLDNPSATEVLRASTCNIEDLRKSLQNFVSANTPVLPQSSEADTQPTPGFQRVIQRAIMQRLSTSNGEKEVTGANVLVAIFGEKDSHAVYLLHQQGVTQADVVNRR